jgi:transposase
MAKVFTNDFKQTIIDLHKHGKSVNDLSIEYGVSKVTLYSWLNKKQEIPLGNETITIEEYKRLQKENLRLKEENDILKKVTAIFSKRD